MAPGKWGRELQNRGFSESYYLGDYQAYVKWIEKKGLYPWESDSSHEGDFEKISDAENNKFRDIVDNQGLGNCGELANYFLEYFGDPLNSNRSPIDYIRETLNSNQSGLFRITISDTHTFIGIRSPIIGLEIEILQAWQDRYSVKEWLNKGQNVFSVSEFVNNLQKLSSSIDFSRASDVLFSTAKTKNLLNKPTSVTKFAFKAFSPAEMDSILLNDLNRFRPDAPHHRKAQAHAWPKT